MFKDYIGFDAAKVFLPRRHKGTKMHKGFIGFDGAKVFLLLRQEGE
jgi:hypothetical protein